MMTENVIHYPHGRKTYGFVSLYWITVSLSQKHVNINGMPPPPPPPIFPRKARYSRDQLALLPGRCLLLQIMWPKLPVVPLGKSYLTFKSFFMFMFIDKVQLILTFLLTDKWLIAKRRIVIILFPFVARGEGVLNVLIRMKRIVIIQSHIETSWGN